MNFFNVVMNLRRKDHFLCSLHSCTVLYVKLTVFDLITCMKYDKVYSAMAGYFVVPV